MQTPVFFHHSKVGYALSSGYGVLTSGLLFLLVFVTLTLHAQDNPALPERPNPPRLVNDFAGILQPTERDQLERKLVDYNDSASTQITIVIVKTTDPYPIGDYAFQIGRKWGVGQKGKNNGLVICWATETRKVFIATGYGLEGAIPDAIAKRIVSETIVPAFKQGQYYQGLDAATTEIIQRAKGEYKADPSPGTGNGDGDGSWVIWLFVGLFILFIIFRNRGGGGGSRNNRGGGFGPLFFPTTFSGWGVRRGAASVVVVAVAEVLAALVAVVLAGVAQVVIINNWLLMKLNRH